MRRAARKDENKDEIVQAFQKMGCSVYDLRRPVDILLGYRERNYLVEIKDGNKPPSEQKLTEAQAKFFATWTGQKIIIKSVDEAIDFITTLDLESGT